MARIRVLDAAVRANTSHFERGMKRASSVLGRFLGVIGVYVGGRGILQLAQDIDKAAKSAQKLGTTTQALMELRYSAALAGTSSNTLDMAIQRMVRRVGEAAKGLGEARNAIKDLGLEATSLAQQRPEEMFRSIADAMAEVESPAERLRLAFKLFDSEGAELVRTLAMGRKGLDDTAAEFRRLHGVVDEPTARMIQEFNDNIGRLKTSMIGLLNPVVKATAALGNFISTATGLNTSNVNDRINVLNIRKNIVDDMVEFLEGMGWKELGYLSDLRQESKNLMAEMRRLKAEAGGVPGMPVFTPVPGALPDPDKDPLDNTTKKLSNLAQTGQSALMTIASGFDIMTIKAQGFGAVVQQLAQSLASMASQTFAQYLLSQATGGFVPNPLSVDEARKR